MYELVVVPRIDLNCQQYWISSNTYLYALSSSVLCRQIGILHASFSVAFFRLNLYVLTRIEAIGIIYHALTAVIIRE